MVNVLHVTCKNNVNIKSITRFLCKCNLRKEQKILLCFTLNIFFDSFYFCNFKFLRNESAFLSCNSFWREVSTYLLIRRTFMHIHIFEDVIKENPGQKIISRSGYQRYRCSLHISYMYLRIIVEFPTYRHIKIYKLNFFCQSCTLCSGSILHAFRLQIEQSKIK